jgi:hypothetical protein
MQWDIRIRDVSLRLEEADARQMVTRARQHVANGRRIVAHSTEHRRLLEAFIATAQNGDVVALVAPTLSPTCTRPRQTNEELIP